MLVTRGYQFQKYATKPQLYNSERTITNQTIHCPLRTAHHHSVIGDNEVIEVLPQIIASNGIQHHITPHLHTPTSHMASGQSRAC